MRLIDADNYIKLLKNRFCMGCNNRDGIMCGSCRIDDAICTADDAPTVDSVKIGHWDMYRTYYRCSNCLCQDALGLAPYCKNCGSRMDNGVI